MLCQDDGHHLTRQQVQYRVQRAARRAAVRNGVHVLRHHVLFPFGDGRRTQLQVALAKFQERAAQLEEQRGEIDRAIAELARASLEIQAMLAARANDEG